MEIREVQNKLEWEEFILEQPDTLFVQSFHYGEFYEALGEKSWILGIYEKNELIGGSLVVSTHAKRGNFLYLPYGPVLDYSDENLLVEFTKFLKNFAKENKYDFVRVSPFTEDSEKNKSLFKKTGYRSAPMHVLAETTWILDLEQPEENLLIDMKKNHRNLIKRCIKENVEQNLMKKKTWTSSTNFMTRLLSDIISIAFLMTM